MSTKSELPGKGKLPLPSPRSPADLDERILSAAKELAPASRAHRPPWWMAGAATACILLVAVMLIPPQQPATRTESDMSSAPLLSEDRATMRSVEKTAAASRKKMELKTVSEPAVEMALELEDRERFPVGAAAPAGISTVKTDLADQLQQLAELVALGEEEKASQLYRQLKLEYPGSDLPETLNEALTNYPATP